MMHRASGVTVSVHCFACRSALEAILFSWSFHLLLDPGYRVSLASHTFSFSQYMVLATIFLLPVHGEHLLVKLKTSICQSNGALLQDQGT